MTHRSFRRITQLLDDLESLTKTIYLDEDQLNLVTVRLDGLRTDAAHLRAELRTHGITAQEIDRFLAPVHERFASLRKLDESPTPLPPPTSQA